MKTYGVIYAFLALMVFGCSKSDGTIDPEPEQKNFLDADYVVLQTNNGILSSQLLSTSEGHMGLNPVESTFEHVPVPGISTQKGALYVFYRKLTTCSGTVTLHDFKEDTSKTIDVFGDLTECNLEVTALEIEGDVLYIAYVIEETAKIDKYYVRTIDLSKKELDFVDVHLNKKPLQLVYANDQLFILSIDREITDENSLLVMDCVSKTLDHEIGLGYDVERIFTDLHTNVVISYRELHTLLNSKTMEVQYINYDDGSEPDFYASRSNYISRDGKLYYKMPTEDGDRPNIPAVYDFSNNLAILYYYENFLTDSQLEFGFKIGDTTMVSYDDENDIMLVGYRKMDNADKGGLLRILLEPGPEFLDNIDLEGVPYRIFHQ